ncbi:MAG TPA: tRNA lysidine(34) synthetase TilS [Candidatus Dormibacteraeota bacterium]|nr:tRNA lysidine(34) synthetase TilS [Candidatus Dormibacteraeota bacterium]
MREFIAAHSIFEPGPVVVACSGGPDSLALLGILHALSGQLGLVAHVAHFDHRMRTTSARDARVVERVARDLGLPLHLGAAARPPRSEAEARDARYDFLRQTARSTGAKTIALGHTRDDQAETVLLHLVRGSGVLGLAAMRPRRDDLARPLLCLAREDTVAYTAQMGVRPVRDPTNASERYARNLVRLRVIPLLERVNPKARDALARVADNAALLADVLRASAGAALDRTIVDDDRELVLDLDRLPSDPAIASEALAIAAERKGASGLSERHRVALLALARGDRGSARVDLPHDVVALREYRRLSIGPVRAADTPPDPVALIPGRSVRWGEWSFVFDDRSSERMSPLQTRLPRIDLQVRAWRPGDRLVGGGKVQDVLTDAKIPRRARSSYPVVVTPSGDVLWVPGLARGTTATSDTDVTLAAKPPETRQA